MRIFAYENFGYEGKIVAVESEVKKGIPYFDMTGIDEAMKKDVTGPVGHIRQAFKNSQIQFPLERIDTHLSPESKIQPFDFELAAALSIKDAYDNYELKKDYEKMQNVPCLVLGSLDLMGNIISGTSPKAAANTAAGLGITNVICNEKDAEDIKNIPGIKIISANSLEDAINFARDGMFVSPGEDITASMPVEAKENAEKKFNEAMKEVYEKGTDKAGFEFVMDYISDAYSLSDEQKTVANDALRSVEEKYWRGDYDDKTRTFGKENSERIFMDLYENLFENSSDSLEAFGWMNSTVKRDFARDLFEKLGATINLNTEDIDVEKLNEMLKEKENSVSFNERASVVNSVPDENSLIGFYKAARAMEVAVAGKHNIILEGKNSKIRNALAESLALYLTPDLTPEEQNSVERIYSIAGLQSGLPSVPFRKPTPDAHMEEMFGGGARLMPGEVSLAHNGILFLKGAEQFRGAVLQILRVPLENKRITLARAGRSTVLPSKFQLIMTMRPSPDGNLGSKEKLCMDTMNEIGGFRHNVEHLMSGMEIRELVEKDEHDMRMFDPYSARKEIKSAYEIQRKRGIFNHDLKDDDISKYCTLDKECAEFFTKNVTQEMFSRKEATNILKVSLTLANMEGRENICKKDIAEAYSLVLPAYEKHLEITLEDGIDSPNDGKREERLLMDLAGLSAARHLASKEENMERYNLLTKEISDYINKNSVFVRKTGVERISKGVGTRLQFQDFDKDLTGNNLSSLRERGFVAEAIEEDIQNMLPKKNIKQDYQRER